MNGDMAEWHIENEIAEIDAHMKGDCGPHCRWCEEEDIRAPVFPVVAPLPEIRVGRVVDLWMLR